MQKRPIAIAFFVLLLLVPALACQIIGTEPTPIEDVIPYPVTVPPSPTRDPSLPPRWIEYERALSSVMLGPIGNTVPDLSRDHGLCEWIFMGGKGEQIYAWALCQNDEGTAVSAPVVIFLGEDGRIFGVVMPEEGWGNLEELFPDPVVESDLLESVQGGCRHATHPITPRRPVHSADHCFGGRTIALNYFGI